MIATLRTRWMDIDWADLLLDVLILLVLLVLFGLAFIGSQTAFEVGQEYGGAAMWWDGFLQNSGTEMLGAFLTFVMIEVIRGTRQREADEKAEKQRQEQLEALQQRVADELATQLRNYMQGQALSRLRAAETPKTRQAILYEMASNDLMNGAAMMFVNLEKASLLGINLTGVNLHGANLTEANLYEANLAGVELERANLKGAVLLLADLTGTNLERANLAGANLGGANLVDSNLTQAHLASALLWEANLIGAGLRGANLTGVDLRGADLTGADLGCVGVRGLFASYEQWESPLGFDPLERTDLSDANLTGAVLRVANLVGAVLRGTDLTGADLMEANLKGVTGLTISQLKQAEYLEGATLPDGTLLPDGEEWPTIFEAWCKTVAIDDKGFIVPAEPDEPEK